MDNEINNQERRSKGEYAQDFGNILSYALRIHAIRIRD